MHLDGSVLVLHRPSSSGTVGEQYEVRSRPRLVLLVRGILENSIVWVAGRKKSLAAHLVAGGRDVWHGNARVRGDSGVGEPEIGPSRTGPEMTCPL